MSTEVIVALIAGAASILGATISALALIRIARVGKRVENVDKNVESVEKHTNSMKDALIKSAELRGERIGKEKEQEKSAEIKSAVEEERNRIKVIIKK